MNSHFPADAVPIKLYRSAKSGHCHRVELMMAFLDLPYETVDLDMANGAHKAADYLTISPFGQVPAIDDNGVALSDSNAILTYLTHKYPDGHGWVPDTPREAAEVQRWLSVAAGEIAYGPCAVRLVKQFGVPLDYDVAHAKALNVLGVMERHLTDREWLAGPAITLADVAGYSYIAHVPEGGIALESYPAIRAWLERVEGYPRFVGMVRSPLPEAA